MATGLIVFGSFMIVGILGGVMWAMIHTVMNGQTVIIALSVGLILLIAILALGVGIAMQMGEL